MSSPCLSSGCHHGKTPQPGWQQKPFIFSELWTLGVPEQGASCFFPGESALSLWSTAAFAPVPTGKGGGGEEGERAGNTERVGGGEGRGREQNELEREILSS